MRKKGWLQDNIAAILALIIVFFTFIIFVMILTKTISAKENVVFLIVGGLMGLVGAVVQYFFGSSAGSKAKQQAMERINDNTTETTETHSIKSPEK